MPTKSLLVFSGLIFLLVLTLYPSYIGTFLPRWQCSTCHAPIKHHDWPDEDIEVGSILVWLRQNHSLADHSEAVGRDMQPFVVDVVDHYKGAPGLLYFGIDIDEELLEYIRADCGVEKVSRMPKIKYS
jgi:hypothetical protein